MQALGGYARWVKRGLNGLRTSWRGYMVGQSRTALLSDLVSFDFSESFDDSVNAKEESQLLSTAEARGYLETMDYLSPGRSFLPCHEKGPSTMRPCPPWTGKLAGWERSCRRG